MGMHRLAAGLGAATLLIGTQLAGAASAQETPVCGPPGGEVPATIVGAGVINGTSGDDVIVASDGNDVVNAGGGNDIVCGEGGNDVIDGGKGNDTLIGDNVNDDPSAPSNGANNDTLTGGQGDDFLAELGGLVAEDGAELAPGLLQGPGDLLGPGQGVGTGFLQLPGLLHPVADVGQRRGHRAGFIRGLPEQEGLFGDFP